MFCVRLKCSEQEAGRALSKLRWCTSALQSQPGRALQRLVQPHVIDSYIIDSTDADMGWIEGRAKCAVCNNGPVAQLLLVLCPGSRQCQWRGARPGCGTVQRTG